MKWITAKGRGQQYTKSGIRDMRTEQSYFKEWPNRTYRMRGMGLKHN